MRKMGWWWKKGWVGGGGGGLGEEEGWVGGGREKCPNYLHQRWGL